jgi:serine/threonine protein kinase
MSLSLEQSNLSLFNFPTNGLQLTSSITRNTYTIGDMIGEGGFGVVYECVDVWGNNLVAKVLKPQKDVDLSKVAFDELQKLLHVRHPNVTYVYDAFSCEGACYIISERCWRSLADCFADQNFNSKIWFNAIARCVLQAVNFAHLQQLVHCDIHPGNILLKFIPDELLPTQHSATTFKLSDFGLARVINEIKPEGTFLESIRPPEALNVVEYGPIDHRVDIYHVALVLLNLQLEAPRIFTRDEILAGLPRELALGLAAPYSFALEKALRRRVSFRTATAMELWRDLNSPAT